MKRKQELEAGGWNIGRFCEESSVFDCSICWELVKTSVIAFLKFLAI
jgi:hypothetical protein